LFKIKLGKYKTDISVTTQKILISEEVNEPLTKLIKFREGYLFKNRNGEKRENVYSVFITRKKIIQLKSFWTTYNKRYLDYKFGFQRINIYRKIRNISTNVGQSRYPRGILYP